MMRGRSASYSRRRSTTVYNRQAGRYDRQRLQPSFTDYLMTYIHRKWIQCLTAGFHCDDRLSFYSRGELIQLTTVN